MRAMLTIIPHDAPIRVTSATSAGLKLTDLPVSIVKAVSSAASRTTLTAAPMPA